MTMPVDLVLVRHGESEQNLANRAAKGGDTSLFTDEYRNRHASQHRLTPVGRKQAIVTGQWLRENGLGQFDARFVSEYIRAQETAGLLGLDGPAWALNPQLREREWGDLDGLSWEEREERAEELMRFRDTDPFYWIAPNGESIAQVVIRLRSLFDTLHRECADKRVVVVCHGEVMWALRFMIERMSVSRYMELEGSKAPGVKIYNCQVLHYTRRNPVTGELSAHIDWMKSDCPQQPDNSGEGWEEIIRPRFSNDELLANVDLVPHIFDTE